MSRIVITGGPGAGKTALLLALQACGYTIVGDSPRTIIQDRIRRGLSPRPSAHEFVHERLPMDTANYLQHAAMPGYVFFECSVLDALCGLDHIAPLSESELSMWLSQYSYCSKVFLLPAWQAIYVNNAERDHPFEHAESVYRTLQEWYRKFRSRSGLPTRSGLPMYCKRWQAATSNPVLHPTRCGWCARLPARVKAPLRQHVLCRRSDAIVQFGFTMPADQLDKNQRATYVQDLNRVLTLISGDFESAWFIDHPAP
jgi:predicted ATPase